MGVMQNPEVHGINLPSASPQQLAKIQQYFEDKLVSKTSALVLTVIQELAQAVGGKTKQKLAATLSRQVSIDEEWEKDLRELSANLTVALNE